MIKWLVELVLKLLRLRRWPCRRCYEKSDGQMRPEFGVTLHWDSEERTRVKIHRVKELGCTMVRTDCVAEYYDTMRPYLTKFIQWCTNKGFHVILVLSMSSKLQSPSPYPSPHSSQYVEEFLKWLGKLNKDFGRWKSNITLQILNEPNSPMFYNLSSYDYMKVLTVSYDYLRGRGWKNVIMAGLVGEDEEEGVITKYVSGLLDRNLQAYTDAFCFHWYRGYDSGYSWVPVETVKYIRARGWRKKIYVTEFGTERSEKNRCFDHFYFEFGKQYNVRAMLWYCVQNNTPHQLLHSDLSPTEIYNYIKERLGR